MSSCMQRLRHYVALPIVAGGGFVAAFAFGQLTFAEENNYATKAHLVSYQVSRSRLVRLMAWATDYDMDIEVVLAGCGLPPR